MSVMNGKPNENKVGLPVPDILSSAKSLFLGISGAALCVGFVVRNSANAAFGITSFDILDARYVYTGASTLVVLVFLVFFLRLDPASPPVDPAPVVKEQDESDPFLQVGDQAAKRVVKGSGRLAKVGEFLVSLGVAQLVLVLTMLLGILMVGGRILAFACALHGLSYLSGSQAISDNAVFFVAAGSGAFVLLASTLLPMTTQQGDLDDAKTREWGGTIMGAAIVLIAYFSEYRIEKVLESATALFFISIVWVFVLKPVAARVLAIGKETASTNSTNPEQGIAKAGLSRYGWGFLVSAVLAFGGGLLILVLYATFLFPVLPPSLGGGAPPGVVVRYGDEWRHGQLLDERDDVLYMRVADRTPTTVLQKSKVSEYVVMSAGGLETYRVGLAVGDAKRSVRRGLATPQSTATRLARTTVGRAVSTTHHPDSLRAIVAAIRAGTAVGVRCEAQANDSAVRMR